MALAQHCHQLWRHPGSDYHRSVTPPACFPRPCCAAAPARKRLSLESPLFRSPSCSAKAPPRPLTWSRIICRSAQTLNSFAKLKLATRLVKRHMPGGRALAPTGIFTHASALSYSGRGSPAPLVQPRRDSPWPSLKRCNNTCRRQAGSAACSSKASGSCRSTGPTTSPTSRSATR